MARVCLPSHALILPADDLAGNSQFLGFILVKPETFGLDLKLSQDSLFKPEGIIPLTFRHKVVPVDNKLDPTSANTEQSKVGSNPSRNRSCPKVWCMPVQLRAASRMP